jgi:hypothetical protein
MHRPPTRPSGDCIIASGEHLQDISRKNHGGLKTDFMSVIPFAASRAAAGESARRMKEN